MCHQHLSFSYTSKVFLLALLDTPIPSPFISMWLLQISITPGSMNELKSNCWSSFTVITNIVHRALRCQPKWLQTLGSFSTRARAADCNVPLLGIQKIRPACPEMRCRVSCFGDEDLEWISLREGPASKKSSAKIMIAVPQPLLPQPLLLVAIYIKILSTETKQ